MGIKKFPSEGGVHVPPSTPPPPEKSVYFFALPSMNGPLPAELKFGENPEYQCFIKQIGDENNGHGHTR